MKTLYESLLSDFDTLDRNNVYDIIQGEVEETTGWTLSSDGKYILSGTKHFPGNINIPFGGNKEWFEALVNCAKKHDLKIQPLGELTIPANSLHLLEGVDIEYICELKIHVNNPVDIDLSKIKSPIHRILLEESRGSFCEIKSIFLQKSPVITADVDLYTGTLDMENIKDMNCTNLIILDARSTFGKELGPTSLNRLQQLVDNNPKVTNFYIKTRENRKEKYYQIKLKGKEVVGVVGKSEGALITKGVLGDFNKKNSDYKEWYEKHM